MAMAMGMQVGVAPTLQQVVTGLGSCRNGGEVAALHFAGSSFSGRMQVAASGESVKGFGRVSCVQVSCGAAAAVDGTALTAPRPWKTSDCRLVLEDGSVWRGKSFGATGTQVGEVVFNCSLTGYQEILTDPSYAGQFVLMTQPHIGNIGINHVTRNLARVSWAVWSFAALATWCQTGGLRKLFLNIWRRGTSWAFLILTLELLLDACEKMVA